MKFSHFLKSLCTKLKIYSYSTENDSVYDYGIEKATFTYSHWSEKVESFTYEKSMNFFEILVPTSDTVKFKYILKTLLNADNNVLFSGQTGVGKSVISQDFLAHMGEGYEYAIVGFSGKTKSRNLQD